MKSLLPQGELQSGALAAMAATAMMVANVPVPGTPPQSPGTGSAGAGARKGSSKGPTLKEVGNHRRGNSDGCSNAIEYVSGVAQ